MDCKRGTTTAPFPLQSTHMAEMRAGRYPGDEEGSSTAERQDEWKTRTAHTSMCRRAQSQT
jgi:hypothetical protein